MFLMKKKIARVTGASGGIGGACAELLAQEGMFRKIYEMQMAIGEEEPA